MMPACPARRHQSEPSRALRARTPRLQRTTARRSRLHPLAEKEPAGARPAGYPSHAPTRRALFLLGWRDRLPDLADLAEIAADHARAGCAGRLGDLRGGGHLGCVMMVDAM